MSLKHFSHHHRLGLSTRRSGGSCCNMCGIIDYGEIYTCGKCPANSFYIDKSCAKLLREINHPFHPQHPLTFLAKPPYDDSEEFRCSACGKIVSGSTYHCSQCKFDLHIYCAKLMPIRTTTHHNIGIGEPHPLFICESNRESDFNCSGCFRTNMPRIYVCIECKILLDKSCVELPKEIKNHPFHPDHTLILLPGRRTNDYLGCSACSKECCGLFFHCFECEFNLDVKCSFLMPIKTFNIDDDRRYVRHSHPLFLCKNTTIFRFRCDCDRYIDDDSIICCLECHRLMDESCAELPPEIEHLFHRLHPLKLRLWSTLKQCIACLKQISQCSDYVCDDCDFQIDFSCAFSTPVTLSSQLHRHPLAFFSIVAKDLCCTLCNLSGTTNLFRCLDCNFNVHFLCIPGLPRVISDGNHIHLLTLTETPVKDHEDEDSDDEFLCDRCEKERSLYDLTYYCAECHYVAHLQCVLSEVIRLLEEECSLAEKLGDKTEVEGTMSEKLTTNNNSVLYSVAEIDEEIIALRAEVEEKKSEVETSREELKAFEEKFPQFADLFLLEFSDSDSD